jgi:histidinol-phosphate aminotransferase
MLWVETSITPGRRYCLKVNDIKPRSCIQTFHREIDIGLRGNYKFLLDKNEKIGAHEKNTLEELQNKVTSELLSKYPNQQRAYSILSSFLNHPEDNIVLFPGSDSALKAVFESFIDPGDRVIIPSPTYAMAEVYAKLYQANVSSVEYLENKDIDIEKIKNILDENPNTRMLYIPNPGQPFGNLISKNSMRAIISKAENSGTLVVVDEAYYGFSNESVSDLVSEFTNLIVMRTFSKLFGLAGVRIGYLILPNYIKNIVQKVKPLHDINSFSLAALEVVIDNYDDTKNYIDTLMKAKEFFQGQMSTIGFSCYYNYTNFIYVLFPEKFNSAELDKILKKKGILARFNYGEEPSLRITLAELPVMKYVASVILEHANRNINE